MELALTELLLKRLAAKVAGRLHYAGFLKLYLRCAGIRTDNAESTMELYEILRVDCIIATEDMIGNYLQGLDLIDLDLVSEEDRQDMMLLEDFMFRGPLLMHVCQIARLW